MLRQFYWRFIVTLVSASMLVGCAFSKLEKDLEKIESVTHIFAGELTTDLDPTDPFVVIAMRDSDGEQIAAFRVMAGPEPFEIRSDPTPTFFFGFDDLNKDLRFQASEPHGWAAGGRALDPSKENTGNIIVSVTADPNDQPAYPKKLVGEPLEDHFRDDLRFNVGTVSSLDNPLFSEDQASKGLWQPFQFLEDGGTGIHFLEPYDPEKVPVLFVHGILDSPLRFAPLIEHLDQSRYQPWVYSYPSGIRLSFLAGGMYQFLEMLHRIYAFDELHVVAHSMGGLVSRGGINRCTRSNSCKYLRTYTTISTPWNGVASAASGVKWAPTVVPVWLDLDPTSEYVTTLFDTPLPDGLPHQLLFGFRQDSFFGSESSDGTITLSSQLRMAAQEQAQVLRGFDEGHVSILSNESVAAMVNQFLEQE